MAEDGEKSRAAPVDVELLRHALRAEASEGDSDVDSAVEQMGDRAFDWIVGELRGGVLTSQQQLRALGLLALLCKEACVARRGELLDWTMEVAQSPTASLEARSVAVLIAALGAVVTKHFPGATEVYDGRSADEVRVQVQDAARRALAVGVTPETEALIGECLAATGPAR